MCPYPLKVQARPPCDQKQAFRSRVSLIDWGGVGAELFKCPYLLKVQARPPCDQKQALLSRVSLIDWGGVGGVLNYLSAHIY